jgi:ABC-type phosphate/phosphonate transport system substrate-binding protein
MVAARSTFVNVALFVAFALMKPTSVAADQAAAHLKELRLASIVALGPGINSEDGRLALELIMQKTLARKTDPYRVKLSMLSGLDQVVPAMARDRLQFLALTSLDYAELRLTMRLTPLIILSKHDQPYDTFMLVSQKNRDLESLAQDAKRIAVINHSRVGELVRLWLDTVLWQAGYPESGQFFTTIKRANKPSQVLLPVFFGQADACVITASAFALMAEFNPQIEKRLAPMIRSPQLVSLLVCATEHAAAGDQKLMLSEVKNFEQDATVQQALTIVQMKRVIPFRPEYFEATAAVIETYRQLKGRQTGGDLK